MIHLPHLIIDLGLILGAAGITTLLFKRLKQPVVLGYILAGLLVGPYLKFLPTISDIENIKVWAEIGVIFLLFSLGLEFSFKKLVKVGAPASVTAIVEVIVMLLIGYATGKLMGWTTIDSIFLGGILSISSTTIIIRAFEELGIKSQRFAILVFGALIVEDLVAIVLLVLLSTLSVSQQFAGSEMLFSVLKLVFFLALWFIGGIFLLPTFLKRIKGLISDETLLIISLALCFAMVILATQAGFSPALGAFVMGSLLAETTKAERIEHLVQPVKDLFGAIFFVSVGMLINPAVLAQYTWPVIIITLITILGKAFSSSMGALLAGQPLKTAVRTGLSLSQIGEFSFIIATLGVTLKVTSDFLYPIAVAVSAITTFTTPYLIKFSPAIHSGIERILPGKWKLFLNRYSSGTQKITAESDWRVVLKSYLTIIIVNVIILVAILIVSEQWLAPFMQSVIEDGIWVNMLTVGVTLLVMLPFLWALGIKKLTGASFTALWMNRNYNKGPLVLLELLRVTLVILVIVFLLEQFFPAAIVWAVVIPGIIIGLLLFSQRLQQFYTRLEKRFLHNLNARENDKVLTSAGEMDLLPWDLHLATFEVSSDSGAVGKTLIDLQFREDFGINIAEIERGNFRIPNPQRNDFIFPGDKLIVIGTDEQLEKFRQTLDMTLPQVLNDNEDVILQRFVVEPHSILHRKTIRETGIRERTKGLVVGIERDGERILNPPSTAQFMIGDIVWIVGVQTKVQQLISEVRKSF